MNCLNCKEAISGKYCANCGQRTSTKRITMSSLLENLLVGVSNINRGFLYNLRELSLRPGRTIMGYLDGERVKVFHPVQYAMIGVTILTFVDALYGTGFAKADNAEFSRDTATYSFGYRFGKFLRLNIKYMWLLTIPAFSLPASWLFPKLNFAEHLTVQSFICGHAALITVCVFPFVSTTFVFNPLLYFILWILMCLAYRRFSSKWELGFFTLMILLVGLLLFIFLPATFLWLVNWRP